VEKMRKFRSPFWFLVVLSLAPLRAFAYTGINPNYLIAAHHGYPYGPDPRLGQMQMVDMRAVYASMAINWGGAQPMGFSYLPPMGISALGSSLMYNQMARGMAGVGY
jgi:hypothetical protein